MMQTLFLHPPSFDGFDGGAGSRYQAKREIRSFWYPTWLAQPAALVPGSRLIDAPPAASQGTATSDSPVAPPFEVGLNLDVMERKLIEATLERFNGHRARTAEALGIGLRTLSGKLKAYGYAPRAKPGSAKVAWASAQSEPKCVV